MPARRRAARLRESGAAAHCEHKHRQQARCMELFHGPFSEDKQHLTLEWRSSFEAWTENPRVGGSIPKSLLGNVQERNRCARVDVDRQDTIPLLSLFHLDFNAPQFQNPGIGLNRGALDA